MTASEMHISFKQGLDKFDSKNYPNILPEEIDLVLNQAQNAFIKQRYGYTNDAKQGFEETQKRTEDLKNLVTMAVINNTNGIHPNDPNNNINVNAQFVDLPADYWIAVQELARIKYPDCNNQIVQDDVFVAAIQHNDYSKLIISPFGKPNNSRVLRLMTTEGVELVKAPTSTLEEYRLRYIRKPKDIDSISNPNQDCELPQMVHQEIVNLAISITLENIEAQRIKTFIAVTENREE